jgi:hypothetical protein
MSSDEPDFQYSALVMILALLAAVSTGLIVITCLRVDMAQKQYDEVLVRITLSLTAILGLVLVALGHTDTNTFNGVIVGAVMLTLLNVGSLVILLKQSAFSAVSRLLLIVLEIGVSLSVVLMAVLRFTFLFRFRVLLHKLSVQIDHRAKGLPRDGEKLHRSSWQRPCADSGTFAAVHFASPPETRYG